MATKRFKTEKDLVNNEFRKQIEVLSSNVMLKTLVFNTYSAEPSLKDKTRISRKKRLLPPRDLNISLETNIEEITMSELLSSSVMKRFITELMMQQIIEHMVELNVNYVVSGNHKTYWSLNGHTNQEENDHKEADTLVMRCLKLGSDSVHTNVVSVYSADTDVFFLLLSHSNQLNCSSLFIRLAKGFFDIKLLHSVLAMVPQKHWFPLCTDW